MYFTPEGFPNNIEYFLDGPAKVALRDENIKNPSKEEIEVKAKELLKAQLEELEEWDKRGTLDTIQDKITRAGAEAYKEWWHETRGGRLWPRFYSLADCWKISDEAFRIYYGFDSNEYTPKNVERFAEQISQNGCEPGTLVEDELLYGIDSYPDGPCVDIILPDKQLEEKIMVESVY